MASTPKSTRRGRRVTAELSDELYASLYAAKIYFRKPLAELMREGVSMVVQRYRDDRQARRTSQSSES